MGKIKVVRKGDGTAFQNQSQQFVFVKQGTYFSLSFEQMGEMVELFDGLKNGSLLNIDPDSEDMARGE